MQVQSRELREVDASTEGAWTDLAARALEPNAFFEPSLVRPLALHMGDDVALLSVGKGDSLSVCVPLTRTTIKWRGVPLPAWRSGNPLSTPLVDAAVDIEAVVARALAHLSSLRGPRLLALDYLASDGPVGGALERVAGPQRRQGGFRPLSAAEAVRPILLRREDASYTERRWGGPHRRKLGQKRRKLEQLLGEPLTMADEPGDHEKIEQFLAMEQSGWKGRSGTALASLPRRLSFFRGACTRFSARGGLRVVSLKSGRTTIAMKLHLRSGGAAFALRRAYDEHFARGSPGIQLEIGAIDVFHSSGDRFIDSCGNQLQDPERWLWPDTRSITRFIVELGR